MLLQNGQHEHKTNFRVKIDVIYIVL